MDIDKAISLHQAGRLVEAKAVYESVLRQAPRNFNAWHLLGLAQLHLGKPLDAAACIEKALAIEPGHMEALCNLGMVLAGLGRFDEAAQYFGRAVATNPRDPDAQNGLGGVLATLNRHVEALACFERVIAIQPDHPQAHHNLGKVLAALGRHAEAISRFERAIAVNAHNPFAHNDLGVLLALLNRIADAIRCFERAIALKPDYAEARNNLGNALLAVGRFEEAVRCYEQALTVNPGFAQGHYQLGTALAALDRHADAIPSFERAVAIKPDYVDAYYNLGNSLQALNHNDEALKCYRRTLALKPDHAEAHNNLGLALQKLGQLPEALASYDNALALKWDFAETLYNRGNVLRDLYRFDEAILSYRGALARQVNFAEAHNNLGLVLKKQGRLEEAVASYHNALSFKADYAEAYSNLGLTLQDLGRLDEAIASYRKALSFKPDYAEVHSNLLFCLNYHPDLSAEDIFAEYRKWNECHALPFSGVASHANDRRPERRLRIGYVSPDLLRHSTHYFIEPLLASHDKTQVEVFAYAEVAKEDEVSAKLKSHIDHWRSTVGLDNDKMAAMIRQDGIDILVDLAGHTKGNRLQVFARKPAPIQVSWLGYGYTTGLDAMDYLLADPEYAPPGCESLFSEKIVHLPVFAAYRAAENMGETGPLPALRTGRISFGTLSRSVRINHRVIRTWAGILQRLPDASLEINSFNFQTAEMQQKIRQQFAAYGIAAQRLIVGYSSPPWDVLRNIDISLDCFPHNSGTTLYESLYMGVPYVTLADRPSVGRLGAAILKTLGHPEWIAMTEQDYINTAVALATDTDRLASLRAGLRDQMKQSALMNEPAFARSVESAFRKMWRQWCAHPTS